MPGRRPMVAHRQKIALWTRIQSVVDVRQYKPTKPLVVRQIGQVVQSRSGLVVVQWEDRTRERVNPLAFDEAFSRFRIGQPFETVVTRNPLTFRILRADAVRKLPRRVVSEERSTAIWDRAVGLRKQGNDPVAQVEQNEEQFWLQPPE